MAFDDALAGATIVFDLDGTLVDTAPDILETTNALLADEGLPPLTLDKVRVLIGHGPRPLLARGFEAAGEALSEPRLADMAERFAALYRARIAALSRPFPGAVAALDALAAAGARLAICTNKPTELSRALLAALGLEARFAAVVGPDLAGAAKPDPAHLIAAIAHAGGQIDRAVMVGDSVSDAAAARGADVPIILVDHGYTDIPAAGLAPDILIGHFDELAPACIRLLAPGAEAIARTPATDA
ncbi:MAG: phosphoglycolate phosphatase [Caulobacteraceae bacterium]